MALLLAGAAAAQEDTYEARPGLISTGGIFLFYINQGPLSFRTMTARELPPGAVPMGDVTGSSCQRGLSIPTSASLRATNISGVLGNGGFDRALLSAAQKHPGLAGVYDVRVDRHTFSILGVFRQSCVEILALGFKL